MAWLMLIVAGLFESAWAILMKQSEGFSRLWPTVGFVGAAGCSLYLLAQALKTLPIGSAYAVWTGIGAATTAVLGVLLLNESASLLKVLSIALIVAGIAGLRLSPV